MIIIIIPPAISDLFMLGNLLIDLTRVDNTFNLFDLSLSLSISLSKLSKANDNVMMPGSERTDSSDLGILQGN